MRLLRVTIVLVLTLAVDGCATGDGPPRRAPTSSVVTPVSTAPAPAVHTLAPGPAVPAGASTKGSCFAPATTVNRTDAYRCLADNELLDPCLATADPQVVVCHADPWSEPRAVRLTKRLPQVEPAPGGSRPWAVELDGGIRCVAVTGVVDIVGTLALVYACRDGGEAGLTDESPGARTALYRPTDRAALRRVPITDVWTG